MSRRILRSAIRCATIRRSHSLLRELKRRGMAAPVVAVGASALGFWAATREVWPETREQACWCHKLANVLDKLPRRLQRARQGPLHGSTR